MSLILQPLILPKPDDAHIHLRDDAYLKRTVPDAARQFRRAIVMPNLVPPITTIVAAINYRDRILSCVPDSLAFTPLMTLYLTDQTTPQLVQDAVSSQVIHAFKWYPAGATTHADAGVKNWSMLYPVFATLEKHRMPLLVHAEVTDPDIDIFEREARFIDTILCPIIKNFPALRLVCEHISTQHAIKFVTAASENVAATITAHHLLLNRNDLLVGGIKPHHYCLPILKTAKDQQALLQIVKSGNPKFFLGTDSAPHALTRKETTCGCAGVYTAYHALELYAAAFAAIDALAQLPAFASQFAADFYGLPYNQETIILTPESKIVPETLDFGADEHVVPLYAGQKLQWRLTSVGSI